MKIKAEDYSLISNKWIDERINNYKKWRDECYTTDEISFHGYNTVISELEVIKITQITPAIKLVEACVTAGGDLVGESDYTEAKEDFIYSEIEIL